jgi:hypothetical protein
VIRTGIDVQIYPRDARIIVHRQRYQDPPHIGKRGKITEFSDKSRNRLLFCAFNARVEWLAFIGLTYPAEFPTDGAIVRAHRNTFLIYLRREYPLIYYLWALEFQKRGAPHIHLLVDQFISLQWLSEIWYQIVGSGDEKHLRAGTRVEYVRGREHGASYLAKSYTAKRAQKEVPVEYQNVGRFWGMSRGLVVPQQTAQLDLSPQAMSVVRPLRRFVEKNVKVRRLRPVTEHHSRKRFVKRKPNLRHLHTGLNGFTIHKGAPITTQLLNSINQPTEQKKK